MQSGRFDPQEEPDGSTTKERIENYIANHPECGALSVDNGQLYSRYTHKVVNRTLVELTPGEVPDRPQTTLQRLEAAEAKIAEFESRISALEGV